MTITKLLEIVQKTFYLCSLFSNCDITVRNVFVQSGEVSSFGAVVSGRDGTGTKEQHQSRL